MPINRRTATILLWLVGIGMYVAVVLFIGWRPIVDSLAHARPAVALLMAAITLAALWVRVLKWRLALGPGADAVSLFWLSKAAGEWSPGRIGELSPLLLRRYRTPRIAAWIVVDRVLEMVTTMAIGISGVALIRAPNRMAILVSAAIIIALLTLALAVLAQRRWFEHAAERLGAESRIARTLRFAAEVSGEIRAFKNALPVAVLLTVVPGLMDVWAGIVLYQTFDVPVSFALVSAVKGLHAVTSAVPFTPNATGVPYLTAAVLLHQVGGVPSEILAAAIALAVALSNVIFWLSALAAAPYLRRPH